MDDTTDIDQLWNDFLQALSHTFRRAHNQAYEGRNDRPKQHTRQTKGTNPGTYLRHNHNSANSHFSTSIRLARLRRQHRRHNEYWDIHHNRTQTESSWQLWRKLQYNLQQLGCPFQLRPNNQQQILNWIQQEIQSIESQQQQARIIAWRRRLRNSNHRTWKWLGRGKFTAQLAYISESNRDIIHTDQLIDRIHQYWQAIWPQPTEEDLQQQAILAQQQPWPAIQAPQLPTFRPEDIRRAAKCLAGKAPGLDGWTGEEVAYCPRPALEIVASFYNYIEQGHPWPSSTTHWRQLHIAKPGKPPDRISSSRPLSISSIWYRIWSSHRIKQLAPWFKQIMPEEQHGCLQGKGIHTALIPNLAAVEANLSNSDQAEDYRFVGGADLSKAFDRLAWQYSTAAMQRMGIPAGINNAIAAAWRQQQRWITTANYVSGRPYSAQCLSQGDSASPIGLLAIMSEAYRRIRAAHPQDQHGPQRHSIFVDDRFWITARASTCVTLARAWQQATAQLNLGENASKADFNAFGHKSNVAALQDAINQAGVPGTIKPRMRILGTFTQPNRRASGPTDEEKHRINRAAQVIRWVNLLPHTTSEKAAFAKATGMALAAAPSYSRIPAAKSLNPLRLLMAKNLWQHNHQQWGTFSTSCWTRS